VLKPNTNKLLCGWTATPKRHNVKRSNKEQVTLDGAEEILSLKSVYQKIVYSYPLRKAIKTGWLVPLKGFKLQTGTHLEDVKTTAGDYQLDQLSDAVNTPDRNIQIVKAWQEHAENRSTVAFCVDIKHSQDLAAAFAAQGVRSAAVWGADPNRATKLERLKSRDLTVLTNCAVLVEGFDAWQVGCIILARPTKSSTLFTQMVGRSTRLQEGTGNLLEALKAGIPLEKKDAYVLDVVDCNKKCSLVTLPSLVGLPPAMDLHGESMVEVAEKMEALTEKYPSVDLSHLTDLSKVKAYVMSLDLFAEPYPQEVIELSKLTWMPAVDDSYTLAIPESKDIQGQYSRYIHERLCIMPNELGEFVLSITTTQTNRQLGVYNTLPEAFASADEVVLRCRASRLPLLLREAAWHSRPASSRAIKALRRLGKGNPVLMAKIETGITSGECSAAINKLKARKG
jgi:hypothetical protein